MGLLNWVFGKDKKKLIALEESAIKKILADCFEAYAKKHQRMVHVRYDDPKDRFIILPEIEALISRELIDTEALETTEKTLFKNISALNTQYKKLREECWGDDIALNPVPEIERLLKKLKEVLETQFQLVQYIKANLNEITKDSKKSHDIMGKLWSLIDWTERTIIERLSDDEAALAKKIDAALMKVLTGGTEKRKKSPPKIKPSRDSIGIAIDMATHWRDAPLLPDIINDDEALAKRVREEHPELTAKKVLEVVVALRENLHDD